MVRLRPPNSAEAPAGARLLTFSSSCLSSFMRDKEKEIRGAGTLAARACE